MFRSFHLLVTSQSLANLADVFLRLSLIADIYLVTHSVMATTVIPVLIGLSAFIASFLVPLVTKKLPMNQVLSFTQLAKTLLLLLLVVSLNICAYLIAIVYLCIVGISIFDGFAQPVSSALIPTYLTDLARGNALFATVSEIISVVGWSLGGILYGYLHLVGSLWVIFALYLLASILSFVLPTAQCEVIENETSWQSVTKGWRFIFTNKTLSVVVGCNLFEILANSIWVSSIILVFVTQILHQDEHYWGYINTTYSLGIILGGALIYRYAEKVSGKKGKSIIFALLFAASMTLIGLVSANAWIFLICSVGIGFFSQLKEIPETVLLQSAVAENQLVHLYAALEVISTLSFSLFTLVMSSLAQYFGVRVVFMIAILALVVEAWIYYRNQNLINE
ncbi:MFS transporter [Enterococcus cecorum]|uniref:MFS transporter n=2 Tax=Enterococcus cecorum TaxID=44008 RepID=UPI0006417D44|nr:MFS transporter [Enterococcus cecorum]KLN91327.1 MFS transporter [Enterococcus cecorum]KLN91985.1 MFS transporter [Enterococcus cecorum]KLO64891.1 MFS transporter [Enterococcus cecorum]CAI3327593.1 MFS transporter [Enterococcus cecorum]CAI3362853.1 MFS transporter [Enterococcus cecorum]